MERLDSTASRALRQLLATQPLGEAKVRFAWTIAAGPALSRAAVVEWRDGTLDVRARSAAWCREINRARSVILSRMTQLLGPDAIQHVRVLEG